LFIVYTGRKAERAKIHQTSVELDPTEAKDFLISRIDERVLDWTDKVHTRKGQPITKKIKVYNEIP